MVYDEKALNSVQPWPQSFSAMCHYTKFGMASSEGGAASLAAKCLYLLGMAMLAIPNQRVDVSIADSEVRARLVGTGEAVSVYPLGCAPAAFHLTPRTHRCRRCPYNRRRSGGETTSGAIVWGSWLKEALGYGVPGLSS